MTKVLWILCIGLCFWISISQSQIAISCRFRGVFHVEKGSRYALLFEDAKKVCIEIDAIIATKEQVDIAHESGFETCRYGWVENNTVLIPRINKNPVCAANFTGVFVLNANQSTPYDVYCYNASETSERNCEQYDYKNKSVISHDPTDEGVFGHSGSSKVSPTHPGHDIDTENLEQGTTLDEGLIDTETTTEPFEHSGDHKTEDGDFGNTYIKPGDNGFDSTTETEDHSITVTFESDFTAEDGIVPATDPSIDQDSGSVHGRVHEHNPSDEKEMGNDPIGPEMDTSDSNQTKQKRKASVPEWLIVCVALVCLGLIFSVCIALNARRLCGQKKKLVINGNKGNKGCPEDGVIMEQNGDTVKSQEMVQLVSRDQSSEFGDQGDALTQDEIRNTKDVDMKIGV